MEETYTPPKILCRFGKYYLLRRLCNRRNVIVLRRLDDYLLRRKVIEELKSKPVKVINWFKIVLIELKEKLTLKRYSYKGLIDSPKYDGKMYEYHYVLPSHRRVNYYFDTPNTNKKSYCLFENDIFEYIKHPVVSYAIQSSIKDIYNWDSDKTDETTIREIKDVLQSKKKHTNVYYMYILQDKLYKERYNPKYIPSNVKPYLIKMRFETGKMDLTKTPRTFYNPKNLKYWDKTTMKTSNKGLTADTTYSWSANGSRGGWTFGGITAKDLERICLINGFEKEKKKKYQYGDYADWYLHKLL